MPNADSRVIWVGMEYRFIPSIARLIQETDEGKIGEPRMLAIREHRFPFLRKVGHWNRFNRYSGAHVIVEDMCARIRTRARTHTHTHGTHAHARTRFHAKFIHG
jgi:predicted dehydrogenase